MTQSIYFIGICGTGMAPVAGLAKAKGFQVSGSDNNVYPPMSTMLESLKISIKSPYSPKNFAGEKPDITIMANVLSRGHCELEHALEQEHNLMSFPQFLGSQILNDRQPVVVAGTHGKTTTTALLAHVLESLNLEPGYLIGGIPLASRKNYNLGKGRYFVIEGDEYDTSCFDKDAKFLHYRPHILLLNNIEFDHADIFPDQNKVDAQFLKLCEKVSDPKNIIANIDDPGVQRILAKLGIATQITRVSSSGQFPEAEIVGYQSAEANRQAMSFRSKTFGDLTLSSPLIGKHNKANTAQALGALVRLLSTPTTGQNLGEAFGSFAGVKRRMELLGKSENISVFEDFAHHPTSVKSVLETLAKTKKFKRIIAVFEPKNATSRRKTFLEQYANSFTSGDVVLFGPCPQDKRIPAHEQMDLEALCQKIGNKARHFSANDAVYSELVDIAEPGDCIIFMSSGSFSNIQHKIVKKFCSVS